MELRETIEALNRQFEEFKKDNDKTIAELKAKGGTDPLLTAKLEKLQDAMDKSEKSREDLEKQLAQVKTAMNRPGASAEDKKEHAAYREAMTKYLRKGVEFNARELLPEGSKLMSVDSDPNGGYFVAPEVSSMIISKVFESSPIRQLAEVVTISSDSLEFMDDLDEVGSGWVGERQTRSATDTPVVGKRIIPVHELHASPVITQKLLDDSSVNLEAWLSGKVQQKFARDEASAFVNGNGVQKPRGFLTYPAGTGAKQIEQVASGHATTFTADGLVNIFFALKSEYLNGATWIMKRTSIREIRKLKDGNGAYLWQPALAGGQPATILDKPYMMADDMETAGAGALALAFGNFREGYKVVDRIGIRVLRDPFSSKPNVVLYTTKRVGGDVGNFEALKIMKVAASL